MMADEDTYLLPRNEKEAERLDEQGRLLEVALDYMIHPSLVATFPDAPAIADIGTGTGDFLVRLSAQYPPKSSFHGFDLSSTQFRSKSTLPPNVSLQVQDIRHPFPSFFLNKFDHVHLRFLVLGLDQADYPVAVRNALTLLHPGGTIQWLEPDMVTSRQLRGGTANTTAANLDFALKPFSTQQHNARTQFDARNTLPSLFEQAGLKDVRQDVVALDRVATDRQAMAYVALEGVISWAKKARDHGDLEIYGGRQVEDVVADAKRDVENGAYLRYDLYCTIGTKSA